MKCLFLLPVKHNYIDVVYLIYLRPLHVSAVQIIHHQVGRGYTRIVKRRGFSLQTVCTELL